MPMIATTIINSTNVKPFSVFMESPRFSTLLETQREGLEACLANHTPHSSTQTDR
jgi:hypothetical protein